MTFSQGTVFIGASVYMAYQRTPITLIDSEGHFSCLKLFCIP